MFKKGDRVRCIDVTDVSRLEFGHEYTILEGPLKTSNGEMVKVRTGHRCAPWFYSYRFVKVLDEGDDLYV